MPQFKGCLIASRILMRSPLEPAVGQAYLADLAGNTGAIGLSPQSRDGHIVIDQVFPGQAADRAGLKAGDIILSTDGVAFGEDMTEARAVMLHISGPVGTTAHFVVQRGKDILKIDVVRQEKPLIVSRMLDSSTGYLFLSAFTQNTPQKLHAALQELLNQHPKVLILDLRDNRGGSTDAAQQVLSDFIDEGLLFTAELKGEVQRQFMAQGDALAPDIPLVLLVNYYTYSSAEVYCRRDPVPPPRNCDWCPNAWQKRGSNDFAAGRREYAALLDRQVTIALGPMV